MVTTGRSPRNIGQRDSGGRAGGREERPRPQRSENGAALPQRAGGERSGTRTHQLGLVRSEALHGCRQASSETHLAACARRRTLAEAPGVRESSRRRSHFGELSVLLTPGVRHLTTRVQPHA
jgi:hypothetical protein